MKRHILLIICSAFFPCLMQAMDRPSNKRSLDAVENANKKQRTKQEDYLFTVGKDISAHIYAGLVQATEKELVAPVQALLKKAQDEHEMMSEERSIIMQKLLTIINKHNPEFKHKPNFSNNNVTPQHRIISPIILTDSSDSSITNDERKQRLFDGWKRVNESAGSNKQDIEKSQREYWNNLNSDEQLDFLKALKIAKKPFKPFWQNILKDADIKAFWMKLSKVQKKELITILGKKYKKDLESLIGEASLYIIDFSVQELALNEEGLKKLFKIAELAFKDQKNIAIINQEVLWVLDFFYANFKPTTKKNNSTEMMICITRTQLYDLYQLLSSEEKENLFHLIYFSPQPIFSLFVALSEEDKEFTPTQEITDLIYQRNLCQKKQNNILKYDNFEWLNELEETS